MDEADDEPGRHRSLDVEPPGGPVEPQRRPWELVILGALVLAVVGSWIWFQSQDDESSVAAPPAQTETAPEPSDGGPAPGDELTVDAYQTESARICDEAPNLAPLFSAANPTFSELESVVRLALSSSVDKTLREMGALVPPPELRDAHAAALAAGEMQATTLRGLARELNAAATKEKAGNLPEDERAAVIDRVTEAAGSLDRQTLAANEAYREMGVPSCVAPVGEIPADDET